MSHELFLSVLTLTLTYACGVLSSGLSVCLCVSLTLLRGGSSRSQALSVRSLVVSYLPVCLLVCVSMCLSVLTAKERGLLADPQTFPNDLASQNFHFDHVFFVCVYVSYVYVMYVFWLFVATPGTKLPRSIKQTHGVYIYLLVVSVPS